MNYSKFWNKKREKKLRELWPTHTLSQIAKALGLRSRSGIHNKARRMGLPKKGPRSIWTDEMLQTLEKLAGEGYGATYIQKRLERKVSLSAVAARVRAIQSKRKTLAQYFSGFDAQLYRRLRDRERPDTVIVAKSHVVDPDRNVVGLLELTNETCRFPFGEPGKPGFGFCGKPVKKGKSWCQDCYSVAVRGVVDLRIPEKLIEEIEG